MKWNSCKTTATLVAQVVKTYLNIPKKYFVTNHFCTYATHLNPADYILNYTDS